jgi:hypothetical protein
MPENFDLDRRTVFVSSTAKDGVVDARTGIVFRQSGARVLGRYRGGRVRRGVLVGAVSGAELRFRYLQVEDSGEIHGGRSRCELTTTPEGRLRIFERFEWTTRAGRGTNVFDELPAAGPA